MRDIAMTRADKLLTAVVLLASILSGGYIYFRSALPGAEGEHLQAVIKAKGKTVRTIDLETVGNGFSFDVQGRLGPSTVEVSQRRIRMKAAPCPDKICVRQGWIESAGESIVCIPGEILIRIEGAAPVDAVTR